MLRHPEEEVSYLPLYLKIRRQILSLIKEHTDYDAPFFSDQELANMYNVNRLTIRRSLENLVEQGLVYRVRGVGTFVRKPPKFEGDVFYQKGLISQWRLEGKKAGGVILNCEKKPASPHVASKLDIPESTIIYHIERIRTADSLPIILDDIFIPFPEIPEEAVQTLTTARLQTLLYDQLGKRATTAIIEIEAVISHKRELEHLKVKPNTPLLKRNMLVQSDTGEGLSYSESLHHPDLFKYQMRIPMGTEE